jgi:ABC-type antimicrobial peptide transport system permease subunit
MTFSSLLLLLRRQVFSKWGRLVLSSGGIAIGIWALTLTTGLSLGLSTTILTAINSQNTAREITIVRDINGETSFLNVGQETKVVPLSFTQIEELKAKNPKIQDINIESNMMLFLPADATTDCIQLKNTTPQPNGASPNLQSEIKAYDDLTKKCPEIPINSNNFLRFYNDHKSNWIGKTTELQNNEIAICFKCGDLELNKKLQVATPKDMLSKEITFQLNTAPRIAKKGEVFDSTKPILDDLNIKNKVSRTYKVVSVIDDQEGNGFGAPINLYYNQSNFNEAYKLVNPNFNVNDYGGEQWTVYIKDYNDLDGVVEDLKQQGLLVFSAGQLLLQSVKTGFAGLNVVLSALGFIALIASIFGIISVMTISVLERRKQIGILKSLGAKNSSIFTLFVLESSIIGIIGWIIGTIFALIGGVILSALSKFLLNINPEIKDNLAAINIDGFYPDFPWWLFLGTLAIAIFFTVVSGFFPARNAAKQNPVDVLRSE